MYYVNCQFGNLILHPRKTELLYFNKMKCEQKDSLVEKAKVFELDNVGYLLYSTTLISW